MKRRNGWWATAVVAALVVGMTTMGTAGARVSSGGTTRGVTDDSIKVGGIVSAEFFGDAEEGAAARFDRENEKGVFGRTIDFIGASDDTFDPNTNIQESRRLVTSEEVFAIVPVATVVMSSGDFLEQQKVPFLGWGISSVFCENDYAYGWSGCVTPNEPAFANSFMMEAGATQLGEDPEGLTMAQIAEDTDAARSGLATLESAADDLGMETVYSESPIPSPPATVGDFTPFVQDIMTSDGGEPPDMVLLLLAGIPATLGLQAGLRDAGYEGPIINTQTYDPAFAGPAATGGVYVQFGAFETADTVPGVQTMLDDLDAAGVSPTVLAASGWLSADMFIKALKKTGKNLTVESFQKAANKLTYRIKGLVGPTKLGDKDRPTPCGTLVTSNGTGYDVTVPYFCAQAFPFNG